MKFFACSLYILFVGALSFLYVKSVYSQEHIEQHIDFDKSRDRGFINKSPQNNDDIPCDLVENAPDLVDIEQMHQMRLGNQPFAIGLEIENNIEFYKDLALAKDVDDDILELEQLLTIDFFYPVSDIGSFFLALEFFNESAYQTESGEDESSRGIAPKQLWLYFQNIFDTCFSLHIGRREYEANRQWWWGDEELDVMTLHYDVFAFHAEFTVGQEIAKASTADDRIDPEREKILRVIGQASYEWTEDQSVEAIFLYQNDHSSGQSIGERIHVEREDPIDADLTWVGGRASGLQFVESLGEIEYWIEGAWVYGKEIFFDYEEVKRCCSEVDAITKHDVSGWGFDVGLTLWTELKWEPFITVGYAWGSGDHESDSGKDESFRQTGLHANEDRYLYYGKLLEPELSNLKICTTSLGFHLCESCSIEIVYHNYRQVKATSFLRQASIEADLEGMKRDIGDELDLIIIIEKWENLELMISGAWFEAGPAFGSLSGQDAYFTGLEMVYRF